jgi:sterol desaturase/sphingolipid hydroxylase (fatty acid hydroxylase superfamily)
MRARISSTGSSRHSSRAATRIAFHAIHHSSRTVDWLSSVRLHPVNDAIARIAQVLPLYWMGFNGLALASFVPFLTFYALLLHANVNRDYGRLRYFHREPGVPSMASHAGRRRPRHELRRS